MWDYRAFLNGGEAVNNSTAGTCITGPCTGSFFTLYDVQGFVGISGSLPTGWTYTVQAAGLTPSTQSITDGAAENITFHYTGTSQIVGTGVSLGDFFILTKWAGINNSGVYSYQTNGLSTSGLYAKYDAGQGQADVPATPEPTTMLLFGSGLLALGAFLRRKGTAVAA